MLASRDFMVMGEEALARGQREEARRAYLAALELDDRSGDALLRLGQMALDDPWQRSVAIRYLTRAVSEGHFLEVARSEAVFALADLLARSTLAEKAVEMLEALPLGPARDLRYYEISATSLVYRGLRARARTVLRDGLVRYPREPSLLALFAETLEKDGLTGAALFYVERALGLAPADPALTAMKLLLVDDDTFRSQLGDYVETHGTHDPRVLARALAVAPSERLFSLFVESGGLEHVDLTAMVGQASEGDFGERVASALAGYTGYRWVDTDWDGLPEERYTYREGELLRWQVDQNGDGRSESDFDLIGLRLSLDLPAARITIGYDSYPHVGSVAVDERVYDVAPFRFTADFVRNLRDAQFRALRLHLPETWPTEADVASVALRLDDRGSNDPRITTFLRRGEQIVREEVHTDRTILYDYSLGERPRVYLDLASDGHPELVASPSGDGGVYGTLDVNQDGSFEAMLDFSALQILWDLDGDGTSELATAMTADSDFVYSPE
jgi:tetratricopeptide (TPR) repeat protein